MKEHPIVVRMNNGEARKYSTAGGYPLAYGYKGDPLCPDCAALQEDEEIEMEGETIRHHWTPCFVNWEDPWLPCSQCGERIESAYAEDIHDRNIEIFDGSLAQGDPWPTAAIDGLVGNEEDLTLDKLEGLVRSVCTSAGEKGYGKTIVLNGEDRYFVV